MFSAINIGRLGNTCKPGSCSLEKSLVALRHYTHLLVVFAIIAFLQLYKLTLMIEQLPLSAVKRVRRQVTIIQKDAALYSYTGKYISINVPAMRQQAGDRNPVTVSDTSVSSFT